MLGKRYFKYAMSYYNSAFVASSLNILDPKIKNEYNTKANKYFENAEKILEEAYQNEYEKPKKNWAFLLETCELIVDCCFYQNKPQKEEKYLEICEVFEEMLYDEFEHDEKTKEKGIILDLIQ